MQGKRVIELGSGTGLVGLVAASLGAESVVLSDLPEIACHLESNVDLNPTLADRIRVVSYSWGEPIEPLFCAERQQEVDLILCSDLLYNPKSYNALITTLEQLLRQSTIALFAVKLRFPKDEAVFFETIQNEHTGMTISSFQGQEESFQSQGLGLFLVSRACLAD